MTLYEFKQIESEVISLVDKVLNAVRDKSFSDYVLLISRAGYQVENEGTFLSPYVLSSHLEIYQDITRERFLVEYLNSYINLLKNDVCITDDLKEFNLNIQMMIYAQVWESHRLLKTLRRIGGILLGNPYEWKIPFEYLDKNGKIKPFVKSKMMEDIILKSLDKGCDYLAKFIRNNYDSDLRNDFAHASYYIRVENNTISSLDSERYMEKRKIDLYDWEQMFMYSISFSYHLIRIMKLRCDNFIKDYPKHKFVIINWPSFDKPGKIHSTRIYPHVIRGGVEFSFNP